MILSVECGALSGGVGQGAEMPAAGEHLTAHVAELPGAVGLVAVVAPRVGLPVGEVESALSLLEVGREVALVLDPLVLDAAQLSIVTLSFHHHNVLIVQHPVSLEPVGPPLALVGYLA